MAENSVSAKAIYWKRALEEELKKMRELKSIYEKYRTSQPRSPRAQTSKTQAITDIEAETKAREVMATFYKERLIEVDEADSVDSLFNGSTPPSASASNVADFSQGLGTKPK